MRRPRHGRHCAPNRPVSQFPYRGQNPALSLPISPQGLVQAGWALYGNIPSVSPNGVQDLCDDSGDGVAVTVLTTGPAFEY